MIRINDKFDLDETREAMMILNVLRSPVMGFHAHYLVEVATKLKLLAFWVRANERIMRRLYFPRLFINV